MRGSAQRVVSRRWQGFFAARKPQFHLQSLAVKLTSPGCRTFLSAGGYASLFQKLK